ncbi:MAG TPA: hypothetical protein VK891_05040 [Euzebyales bacterium]|nr:hypothetical protein [Euzebyales bacterium]
MLDVDDTDRPLIRMTLAGDGEPDDGAAFIDRIETLLAAGERFVLMLDERLALAVFGDGRWRRLLPWALRRRRRLAHNCAAVAVTVTDLALPRVERTTTALAHLLPAPLSTFFEVSMAEQWVHSRLASGHGQPVPARLGDWQPALASYRVLGSDPQ